MISIKLLLYILAIPVVLVLTQDLLLFSGALLSRTRKWRRKKFLVPDGTLQHKLLCEGSITLDVWEKAPNPGVQPLPFVMLIFHGHTDSMEKYTFLQTWAAELGITSYGLDYRGYGNSTGWPSEKTLNADCTAFYKFVAERTNVAPQQVIILGYSFGCVPAAFVAQLHQVKALILLSAFTSVMDIVKQHPYVKYLAPFVWLKSSVIENVQRLHDTHLVVVNGGLDSPIPTEHAELLTQAYKGAYPPNLLLDTQSTPSAVFENQKDWITEILGQALMRAS